MEENQIRVSNVKELAYDREQTKLPIVPLSGMATIRVKLYHDRLKSNI